MAAYMHADTMVPGAAYVNQPKSTDSLEQNAPSPSWKDNARICEEQVTRHVSGYVPTGVATSKMSVSPWQYVDAESGYATFAQTTFTCTSSSPDESAYAVTAWLHAASLLHTLRQTVTCQLATDMFQMHQQTQMRRGHKYQKRGCKRQHGTLTGGHCPNLEDIPPPSAVLAEVLLHMNRVKPA